MLRMILICGLLLAVLAFPQQITVAQPDTLCSFDHEESVQVPMSDTVVLLADVSIPTGLDCTMPPDGWPMIISMHGGGGNKDKMDKWAEHNAELGYIAVNFTWRGFKNEDGSTGGVYALQSRREWTDLKELTDYFALTHSSTKDIVNRQRIGIEGPRWARITPGSGRPGATTGGPTGLTPQPWR